MQSVAQAVDGIRIGENVQIYAVSTDSRKICAGDLFVALRGERFDGHEYVSDAVDLGASGAMVSDSVDIPVSQVVVSDTEKALGQLAAKWRQKFDAPLVAVSGSNGKTTVKEMIGSILNGSALTLVSQGNYNNAIGLPLSLLMLRETHEYAVVEIGMNQIGEIEYLSKIARPDIAVITNAGAAHLEFLQSVEQVAIEKGALLSGLDESGIAVLNRDDDQFKYWEERAAGRKVISFGASENADVQASFTPSEFGSVVRMKTPNGLIEAQLSLVGAHNVFNAAAATATAIAVGISNKDIKSGIETMRAVSGRLQMRRHKQGGFLLDDTYNANPVSVSAALKVLGDFPGDRRLVIGDMFELGVEGEEFHRQIGLQAREFGIGRLYALGDLSRNVVQAFGRGAQHYEDYRELIDDLNQQMDSSTMVLVKGSRGMNMERIADALCDKIAGSTEKAPC